MTARIAHYLCLFMWFLRTQFEGFFMLFKWKIENFCRFQDEFEGFFGSEKIIDWRNGKVDFDVAGKIAQAQPDFLGSRLTTLQINCMRTKF